MSTFDCVISGTFGCCKNQNETKCEKLAIWIVEQTVRHKLYAVIDDCLFDCLID